MNEFEPVVERAELQQVIRVEHVIGKGTVDSPVRKVVQFWTTDGIMIGEKGINELNKQDYFYQGLSEN